MTTTTSTVYYGNTVFSQTSTPPLISTLPQNMCPPQQVPLTNAPPPLPPLPSHHPKQ